MHTSHIGSGTGVLLGQTPPTVIFIDTTIQFLTNHVFHAILGDVATRGQPRRLLRFLFLGLSVYCEGHKHAAHRLFLDLLKLFLVRLVFFIALITIISLLRRLLSLSSYLIMFLKLAKMHKSIVVFSALDQFKTATQISSEAVSLIECMNLRHVVRLPQFQMLIHIIHSIFSHRKHDVANFLCHLSRDDI